MEVLRALIKPNIFHVGFIMVLRAFGSLFGLKMLPEVSRQKKYEYLINETITVSWYRYVNALKSKWSLAEATKKLKLNIVFI